MFLGLNMCGKHVLEGKSLHQGAPCDGTYHFCVSHCFLRKQTHLDFATGQQATVKGGDGLV